MTESLQWSESMGQRAPTAPLVQVPSTQPSARSHPPPNCRQATNPSALRASNSAHTDLSKGVVFVLPVNIRIVKVCKIPEALARNGASVRVGAIL